MHSLKRARTLCEAPPSHTLTSRVARATFRLHSSQLQPALDLTVVDVSFGNRMLLWRGAAAAVELNRGAAVMHKATKWREHFQWALCTVHGDGGGMNGGEDGGGGRGGSSGGGVVAKDGAGGAVGGGGGEVFDDALTLRCSGGGVEAWPAEARCGACGCLSTNLAGKRERKLKARAAKTRGARAARRGSPGAAASEALAGATLEVKPGEAEEISSSPLLPPRHSCATSPACAAHFGGNRSGPFGRIAMCHVSGRRKVPRVSLGRRPWLCAANESDVIAACEAPPSAALLPAARSAV